MLSQVIFFILATISIVSAIMVVTTKKPVSSALYLVLVMCCLAGLFVLLGALFLAALQIIVYAGAIMVLFLFVIMLLNLRHDEFGRDPRYIQKYLSVVLVAVILVQAVLVLNWAMKDFSVGLQSTLVTEPSAENGTETSATDYNEANWVARTLFTKFLYPFEVTSILLLSAIIGAVVIAKRRKRPESEES